MTKSVYIEGYFTDKILPKLADANREALVRFTIDDIVCYIDFKEKSFSKDDDENKNPLLSADVTISYDSFKAMTLGAPGANEFMKNSIKITGDRSILAFLRPD